ncbi:hypothetical protein [Candidatus Coxiella mudrowiae]
MTEELKRLETHINEVKRVLDQSEVSGTPLGFFDAGIKSRSKHFGK